MIKYKLSAQVNIIQASEYNGTGIPGEYEQSQYILCDKKRERDFLINETIKYFIDKFSFPKTYVDVLAEIAAEVDTRIDRIEKKCATFFNLLCKRKVLVPENWNEPTISGDPLYKPGDVIGNLTVLEVIANKRHVDLYLTANKTTNSTYVLKLLNPKKLTIQKIYREELKDLQREYGMLRSVRHLRFVNKTYGFYKKKPGIAYIKMEYIKGKSLSRYLREAENVDSSATTSLIQNMLEAFSSLHKHNLVHGDIHPSNILVCEDSSIKIIDLGLSVRINTEKNEVVPIGGANFYMPPERINATSIHKFSKAPDLYSDVYQIGLLLYFVLYRKEPFTGFIWEELAGNIKKQSVEFADLSFSGYSIPAFIAGIIKKCLAKKPALRYKTASDILDHFRAVTLEKVTAKMR